MNVRNKLECLCLAGLFSLLWVKPRAYPSVERLKGASLWLAQALLANIRLAGNAFLGISR